MRVREFDRLVAELIVADDHPEVVAVRLTASADQPQNHTRLEIQCADGSAFYLMVRRVDGPGVPRHTAFELPKEAMSA